MNNEKIQQLQTIEQNLQSFLTQKQQLQQELLEVDSSIEELSKTDKAYKIVGSIMISSNKEDLSKELEIKKDIVEQKLKIIQQQEDKIKEKAETLRKEVMDEMKQE
ncbi:prefoldin subunit [Candidatus Woesearchaeota archaeon]|nr:prefoldin subunit [Candidatus Woesearchaeota archaeon]